MSFIVVPGNNPIYQPLLDSTRPIQSTFNLVGIWNTAGPWTGFVTGLNVDITDNFSPPSARVAEFALNGSTLWAIQKNGLLLGGQYFDLNAPNSGWFPQGRPFIIMQGLGSTYQNSIGNFSGVGIFMNNAYLGGGGFRYDTGFVGAAQYAIVNNGHFFAVAANGFPGGSVTFNTVLFVNQDRNVYINGISNRPSNGIGCLHLTNAVVAPFGATGFFDMVSFYAVGGEAYVMDGFGNQTLLSPHDRETNEWVFDSTDTTKGKRLKIRVEAMLRFLNEHFGLDMIEEGTRT